MKPTAITLSRKFNLGNYETLDVGLEAALTEQDNPLDAWRELENMTELYLQNRLAKQPAATPQTAKEQPTTKVAAATSKTTVETVKQAFPEDLESLLAFEDGDNGNAIIIKPRQFLGSENFAKIASAVRGLGGEYVSAGKDSHFRIIKT